MIQAKRTLYTGFAATALALAVSGQAMASDVTVYGRAHVSVDYLDDGGKYSETNLSSNASRLGFKGSHEINPKLKAFFQIEQQINFTTGGSSGGADFATRDTFVGLSGDFGAVQMGRFDSPFKVARGPANLFGDQVGDMVNLTRVGNGRFDERYDNTIQYTTPTYSGFNMKLAYSVYQGQAAVEDTESDVASFSINYNNGPLSAALAYEKVEDDNKVEGGKDFANRGKRHAVRAAASYNITDDFKLVGFYQTAKYDGKVEGSNGVKNDAATKQLRDANTYDVYGLGGEYKVAKNTAVKAMWMTRDSDAKKAGADMWVIGVEHKLDKAVRIYANYALVDNDKNQNLNPWSASRTANPAGKKKDSNGQLYSIGEKASGFTVGLRYDF